MLSTIFASWNPNKYHLLRERPFIQVAGHVAVAAAASVFVFWLLLIPAAFQLDAAFAGLGDTTTLTFDAHMEQTAPTYLLRNPDILFSADAGKGWIVITPQTITIQKFIFFGAKTYDWKQFQTLQTAPVQDIVVPLAFFLLPSFLFWTAAYVCLMSFLLVLLYSLCAYFVMHARGYTISFGDLAKVALYAVIPAVMVLAGLPILRLGLPVAVIVGLCFVAWIVYSLLGTTLIAEKHAPKPHRAKSE